MGENAEAMDALSPSAQLDQVVSDLDAMHSNSGGTPWADAFVGGLWENGVTEEFLKGAYSYPTIDSWPTDGSPNDATIIGQQVGSSLYFAGEHTHPTDPSVASGALQTGLRAAGEIDADHNPQ